MPPPQRPERRWTPPNKLTKNLTSKIERPGGEILRAVPFSEIYRLGAAGAIGNGGWPESISIDFSTPAS